MTSVKEFRVEEEPTDESLGRGSFRFTDDYSVFDWGKMPDPIPDKGASLCTMGAFNFELLEVNHVPTHYEGVVVEGEHEARRASDGSSGRRPRDTVDLGDASEPPREMAIALTRVPDLPYSDGRYDYDAFHAEAGENYLIPLEIVFRNHVPVGSSLRRRTEPADHGLDIDEWPEEAVELDDPIVEFSTKYEEQDRYLDREEAAIVAGRAEIDRLEELALAVNHVVTERAAAAGLTHEDGKIECLYFQGEIRVADVVGTFDENRFSYDGQQVSKEVVRQYYKHTDPEWVEAVAAAKAEARRREMADWRELCEDEPNPLPDHVIEVARDLYAAGANAYTGSEWFDAPDIDEAVEAAREL